MVLHSVVPNPEWAHRSHPPTLETLHILYIALVAFGTALPTVRPRSSQPRFLSLLLFMLLPSTRCHLAQVKGFRKSARAVLSSRRVIAAMATPEVSEVAVNKQFGGFNRRYKHKSSSLGCEVRCSRARGRPSWPVGTARPGPCQPQPCHQPHKPLSCACPTFILL